MGHGSMSMEPTGQMGHGFRQSAGWEALDHQQDEPWCHAGGFGQLDHARWGPRPEPREGPGYDHSKMGAWRHAGDRWRAWIIKGIWEPWLR